MDLKVYQWIQKILSTVQKENELATLFRWTWIFCLLLEDVTDLHVKTGPGSYKTISKHKDGRIQEATTTTCMDRTTMVIKDMQTGKTLKATFEKFTDFSGEYKIISESGLKEFAQAVGKMGRIQLCIWRC